MHIMICGASGLIGQSLVNTLSSDHQLSLVGRNKSKLKRLFDTDHNLYTWEELTIDVLGGCDVIINLAGRNASTLRWTQPIKNSILASRVRCTQKVANLCASLGKASPVLMNASAVSIYDIASLSTDKPVSEDTPPPSQPHSFLAQVARNWEAALLPAEKAGVRVIKLRLSVVLARQGGMLAKILLPFQLGLGNIWGHGKQALPWIALQDVVGSICHLLNHETAMGAFNLVAPSLVSQQEFAYSLAKHLNRPCFLKAPSAFATLAFGEMGQEFLLQGQAVAPTHLLKLGYTFQCPTLPEALATELKA